MQLEKIAYTPVDNELESEFIDNEKAIAGYTKVSGSGYNEPRHRRIRQMIHNIQTEHAEDRLGLSTEDRAKKRFSRISENPWDRP